MLSTTDRAVGEGRGENETLERRAADVPRGYTAPRRMDIWIDCGERVPGHRILSPRTCGPRGFGRLQAPTRRLLWATSRPLVVMRVEPADALDDGHDLLVRERRLTADTVPTQQNLHHHCRVHTASQQMPGQRGDRVVTFTLAHPLPDEPTPVGDRMPRPTRGPDRLPEHPAR